MGTTSVAQASLSRARPVADTPLHIVSEPQKRADEFMSGSGPGWYYDPDDQAIYRYWDGEAWTKHCADVFPGAAPSSVLVKAP